MKMVEGVFSTGHYLKILRAVVAFVFVFVVNNLVATQGSSKPRLYNAAMFMPLADFAVRNPPAAIKQCRSIVKSPPARLLLLCEKAGVMSRNKFVEDEFTTPAATPIARFRLAMPMAVMRFAHPTAENIGVAPVDAAHTNSRHPLNTVVIYHLANLQTC